MSKIFKVISVCRGSEEINEVEGWYLVDSEGMSDRLVSASESYSRGTRL